MKLAKWWDLSQIPPLTSIKEVGRDWTVHQTVVILSIELGVVWVTFGWCVLEPSQFINYNCLGSKVGASALRIGCRFRLELDMKWIGGIWSHIISELRPKLQKYYNTNSIPFQKSKYSLLYTYHPSSVGTPTSAGQSHWRVCVTILDSLERWWSKNATVDVPKSNTTIAIHI